MTDAEPLVVDNTMGAALIGVIFAGIFLTLRVWRLSSHNVLLLFVIMVLVLSEFGGRTFASPSTNTNRPLLRISMHLFTIQALRLTTWAQLKQLKGLSMAVNILAALGDALIAGALCFFLQRSRTGFRKSDTMISKLLSSVVTRFAVYSNSVLATLNARQAIRELGEDDDDLSFSFRMRPMFSKTFESTFPTKTPQQLSSNVSLAILYENVDTKWADRTTEMREYLHQDRHKQAV
ncbi:hypothetical protein H0H92_006976 [Tricholoma furcatifolium]|nr:hypothetical protein H0H92_006976 [Tricholoma furcatifolium]